MYTAAKWDPDAWADLFKKAGAKYVLAPGEHHDGFSNWDSAINPYNAKNYGPHRDLDGDLIKAVRKAGLKTGISDHSSFHFVFIPALARQRSNMTQVGSLLQRRGQEQCCPDQVHARLGRQEDRDHRQVPSRHAVVRHEHRPQLGSAEDPGVRLLLQPRQGMGQGSGHQRQASRVGLRPDHGLRTRRTRADGIDRLGLAARRSDHRQVRLCRRHQSRTAGPVCREDRRERAARTAICC